MRSTNLTFLSCCAEGLFSLGSIKISEGGLSNGSPGERALPTGPLTQVKRGALSGLDVVMPDTTSLLHLIIADANIVLGHPSFRLFKESFKESSSQCFTLCAKSTSILKNPCYKDDNLDDLELSICVICM